MGQLKFLFGIISNQLDFELILRVYPSFITMILTDRWLLQTNILPKLKTFMNYLNMNLINLSLIYFVHSKNKH